MTLVSAVLVPGKPAHANHLGGISHMDVNLTLPTVPCFPSCTGSWSGLLTGHYSGTANNVPWEVTYILPNKSGSLSYGIDPLLCPALENGFILGGNLSAQAGVNGAIIVGTYGTQQVTGISGGFQVNAGLNLPISSKFHWLYLTFGTSTVDAFGDVAIAPGVAKQTLTSVPACNGGPATARFVADHVR